MIDEVSVEGREGGGRRRRRRSRRRRRGKSESFALMSRTRSIS